MRFLTVLKVRMAVLPVVRRRRACVSREPLLAVGTFCLRALRLAPLLARRHTEIRSAIERPLMRGLRGIKDAPICPRLLPQETHWGDIRFLSSGEFLSVIRQIFFTICSLPGWKKCAISVDF